MQTDPCWEDFLTTKTLLLIFDYPVVLTRSDKTSFLILDKVIHELIVLLYIKVLLCHLSPTSHKKAR